MKVGISNHRNFVINERFAFKCPATFGECPLARRFGKPLWEHSERNRF